MGWTCYIKFSNFQFVTTSDMFIFATVNGVTSVVFWPPPNHLSSTEVEACAHAAQGQVRTTRRGREFRKTTRGAPRMKKKQALLGFEDGEHILKDGIYDIVYIYYCIYCIGMIYRCIWMIWIKSLKADNPISVCCIIDPLRMGAVTGDPTMYFSRVGPTCRVFSMSWIHRQGKPVKVINFFGWDIIPNPSESEILPTKKRSNHQKQFIL